MKITQVRPTIYLTQVSCHQLTLYHLPTALHISHQIAPQRPSHNSYCLCTWLSLRSQIPAPQSPQRRANFAPMQRPPQWQLGEHDYYLLPRAGAVPPEH